MRLIKRNLKPIWYCLYAGKTAVTDSDGNETGDIEISYSNPVQLMCNISPASGDAQAEMFGRLDDYDKVIITDQMDCPIDENSVLFVDTEPEYGPDPESQEEQPEQVLLNSYDYIVRRIAVSLHHISYAVSKVKVS